MYIDGNGLHLEIELLFLSGIAAAVIAAASACHRFPERGLARQADLKLSCRGLEMNLYEISVLRLAGIGTPRTNIKPGVKIPERPEAAKPIFEAVQTDAPERAKFKTTRAALLRR